MKQPLVVSDPPHRGVDIEAAAQILGLSVPDTQLKLSYPAPEVLSASDTRHCEERAESLRTVGLSTKVVDGLELALVPWPAPVSSFAFSEAGLILRFEGEGLELGYQSEVLGVYCKPPKGFKPPDDAKEPTRDLVAPGTRLLDIAEALEWTPCFDMYFTHGGALRRATIAPGVVDFSGLGDMRRPTEGESLATTIVEVGRRFGNLTFDARLEHVRPRNRFVPGSSGFDLDMRKGFSFGTLLLRQILLSISPELADLTQYDFGSRLAYVLSRQR